MEAKRSRQVNQLALSTSMPLRPLATMSYIHCDFIGNKSKINRNPTQSNRARRLGPFAASRNRLPWRGRAGSAAGRARRPLLPQRPHLLAGGRAVGCAVPRQDHAFHALHIQLQKEGVRGEGGKWHGGQREQSLRCCRAAAWRWAQVREGRRLGKCAQPCGARWPCPTPPSPAPTARPAPHNTPSAPSARLAQRVDVVGIDDVVQHLHRHVLVLPAHAAGTRQGFTGLFQKAGRWRWGGGAAAAPAVAWRNGLEQAHA